MRRKRLIKGAAIFVVMLCLAVFAYAAEEKAEEGIMPLRKKQKGGKS